MVCFWLTRVSLTVNNWNQSFCRSLIFHYRKSEVSQGCFWLSFSHLFWLRMLTSPFRSVQVHNWRVYMKKRTSSHTSVFLYSETFHRHLHIKGNFNHPSSLHCGRYETGVLQSSDSEESEWLFTLVHRLHRKKKGGGGVLSELDAVMMSIMTNHSI